MSNSKSKTNIRENIVVGTNADDLLTGTLDRDIIDTGEGSNIVWADLKLGSDRWNITTSKSLTGQARLAYDRAAAQTLDATIIATVAPGSLSLTAEQGAKLSDIVNGGSGSDIIFAGHGNDVVNGGGGDDRIFLGAGNDTASGGSGDDLVDGGDGNDIINGDVGNDLLLGGKGDDSIFGGAGSDELEGEDGNDRLWGGSELDSQIGDVLRGGAGNDAIYGEGGQDTLDGGAGKDWLSGGSGADHVYGGNDADTLWGGSGNDKLYGEAGNDWLHGEDGNDVVIGGDGNDTLDGGTGVDSVDGGDGNDVAVFRNAKGQIHNDVYTGGNGTDTLQLYLTASQLALYKNLLAPYGDGLRGDEFDFFSLAGGASDAIKLTASGFEKLELYLDQVPTSVSTRIDGTFTGDADSVDFDSLASGSVAQFNALGGNDVIMLASRNVSVAGYDDTKTFDGGAGHDMIVGRDRNDKINGDTGNDRVWGGAGNDIISGGAGDDSLLGESGINSVSGDSGNDSIGLAGSDSASGPDGKRYLASLQGIVDGGTGWDSLNGGSGATIVSYNASTDNIRNMEAFGFYNGNDNLDLSGYGSANGRYTINMGAGDDIAKGSIGTDTINGGAGNDVLDGAEGNDTILGVAGNDALVGGAGDDLLNGGDGNDSLSAGEGNDVLFGDGGDDILAAGSGSDALYGGIGKDTLKGSTTTESQAVLYGDDGDDTLTAGIGHDVLFGGSGNDTLLADGSDVLFGNLGDDLLDARGATSGNELFGGAGNDSLQGGTGDDNLDGGEDQDVAIFTGELSDYRVSYDDASDTFTVEDLRDGNPDGTDTVTNVETFRFVRGDHTAESLKAQIPTALSATAIEDGLTSTVVALRSGTDLSLIADPANSGLFQISVDGVLAGTLNHQNDKKFGIQYDANRSFTLDPSDTFFQNLAMGQARTVVVNYQIQNVATGVLTPASITWTVTGTNDAPIVSNAVAGLAVEGLTPVKLNALANASDADQGTVLSVTGLPASLPDGVTYDANTRSFTLDPTASAFASLAQGETRIVTVDYKIWDGIAETAANVSWTVVGSSTGSVIEGGTPETRYAFPTGSGLQMAAGGERMALYADGIYLGTLGYQAWLYQGVSYDGQGGINLNPTMDYYHDLAEGQTRTMRVDYHIYDPTTKASSPASITWTVTGTNDAPVVSRAVTGVALEGSTPVTLNALANASDVDKGTVLSVIGVPNSLPAGVTYDANTRSFTLDPTASAYASLEKGETQIVTVNYKVSDGITATNTSVSWTITGIGNASGAAVEDGPSVTQYAFEADSGLVLAGAFSEDNYAQNHFRITVDGQSSHHYGNSFGIYYDGERGFTLNPDDAYLDTVVYQDLAEGETRTVKIDYTIHNPTDGSYTPSSLTWTVTGKNDAPRADFAIERFAVEGAAAQTINALSNSSDVDRGNVLSVSGLPHALPAGVTYNASIHSFTFDPKNPAFAGLQNGETQVVTVNYQVTDGSAFTDTYAKWTIVGSDIATASEDGAAVTQYAFAAGTGMKLLGKNEFGYQATGRFAVEYDGTVYKGVNFTSGEKFGITYDQVRGFVLDPSNDLFQNLAEGQTQTITVSYDLYNPADPYNVAPASVTWAVAGKNDAPVVSGVVTGFAVVGGTANTLNALALATDQDPGSTLSVTDLPGSLPVGVSFDLATQSFSLDPKAYAALHSGELQVVTVDYKVSDGITTTDASVSWNVVAPVQIPVGMGQYVVSQVSTGVTWLQAREYAQFLGGDLASINSESENTLLKGIAGFNEHWTYSPSSGSDFGPWFGLFQVPGSPEPAGGWAWTDGSTISDYAGWHLDQPNNIYGDQQYGHFTYDDDTRAYAWNDLQNNPVAHGTPLPKPVGFIAELSASTKMLSGRGETDYIYGGDISNVINGHDGGDLFAGNGGDDVIDGGDGVDWAFYTGNRNDYAIFYDTVNDQYRIQDLRASNADGTDTVRNVELFAFGRVGINAANLNATAITTAAGQVLNADPGNDIMLGLVGQDQFVFAAQGFGHDVIVDFDATGAAGDQLLFSNSIFNDFAAVLAASQQTIDGILIDSNSDSILLAGVKLDQFNSADVLFVA